MIRRSAILAAAAALVVPAPAAAHKAHCSEPPPADLVGPGLRLDRLLGHKFEQPVHIASEPRRSRRLFVVERTGTIRVLVDGRLRERPFLDLSREIAPTVSAERNERGMATMAFSPRYRTNGRFYVFYSDRRGDIRVDEFRRGRNPNRARMSSRRNVLWVKHFFEEVHYGGQIAFGPDGLLYVSVGDAEMPGHAQLNRPYGKILRLNPRGSRPPEIVASGLRNPYRFSFDPRTGDLVVGDVGRDLYEEIDVVPAGRRRIANFGWPFFEGPVRLREGTARGYVPPALAIEHPTASAVVAGHVVTAGELPAYTGRFIYGDFCDGWIATAELGTQLTDVRDEGVTLPFLSTFGIDASGGLYAASTEGGVYRVTATGS